MHQRVKPSVRPRPVDPEVCFDIRQRPTADLFDILRNCTTGTPLENSVGNEIRIRNEMFIDIQEALE